MSNAINEYRGSKEYGLVYAELITAAKYRGYVTYQEIAKLLDLAQTGNVMGKEISQILGAISEDEVSCRRPMLSAIAVGVSKTPGKGFFGLAKQLGKLDSDDENEQKTFWEQECQAVHETWKVILPKKN